MKKVWTIALVAMALLTIAVCWGSTGRAQNTQEPVLTQQITCIVLAKTNRELVVKSAEHLGAELRTVRITKSAKINSETVQVGDLVQLETVLHSDNSETLRTAQVLSTAALSMQEAQAVLAGAPMPDAVATFAAAQRVPPAESSTSEQDGANSEPSAQKAEKATS